MRTEVVENLQKTDTGILFEIPQNEFGPMEFMWQKSYPVTYDFVSGTEGKELPQEVEELLPEDDSLYAEGSTVSAKEFEPDSNVPDTGEPDTGVPSQENKNPDADQTESTESSRQEPVQTGDASSGMLAGYAGAALISGCIAAAVIKRKKRKSKK